MTRAGGYTFRCGSSLCLGVFLSFSSYRKSRRLLFSRRPATHFEVSGRSHGRSSYSASGSSLRGRFVKKCVRSTPTALASSRLRRPELKFFRENCGVMLLAMLAGEFRKLPRRLRALTATALRMVRYNSLPLYIFAWFRKTAEEFEFLMVQT